MSARVVPQARSADRRTPWGLGRFMLLAVSALAVSGILMFVSEDAEAANLGTSFSGTWCDESMRVRYDYYDSGVAAAQRTFNNGYNGAVAGGAHPPVVYWKETTATVATTPYGTEEPYEMYRPLLPLGFTFEYFDRSYNSISASVNGIGYFEPRTTAWQSAWDNSAWGSAAGVDGIVAPLWADLYIQSVYQAGASAGTGGAGGGAGNAGIWYGNQGGKFILWWEQAQPDPWSTYPQAYPDYDFGLKLYPDDSIEFHYDYSGHTEPLTAIVGLESPTGTKAITRTAGGEISTNVQSKAIRFVRIGDIAPVAGNDAFTVNEDAVLTVSAAAGLLVNDKEELYCVPLTAVDFTTPSNGDLSPSADGSFTYTPDPDFCGTDSFQYKPYDDELTGNAATVTITVTCVNDPLTNVVPAAALEVEAGPSSVLAGTMSIMDIDAGMGVVQTNLTIDGGATITLDDADVTVFSGALGTGNVGINGTLDQVNAALATIELGIPGTCPTTFTLIMDSSDLGNTGIGGPSTDLDKITLETPDPCPGSIVAPELNLVDLEAYVDASTDLVAHVLGSHETAAPEDMLYTVTAPPTKGALWVDGIQGATTFTQADLDGGLVLYVAGTVQASDQIGLKLEADGLEAAGTLEIQIIAVPDPVIEKSGPTSVTYGQTKTIGQGLLRTTYVTQPDPAGLVYSIDTAPDGAVGGLLLDDLALTGTFSQQDIDDGLLAFTAGTDPGVTSFAYTVTAQDGRWASGTFQITVSDPVPPTAIIGVEGPYFVDQEVNFFDESDGGTGTLTSWEWDMGDGSDPRFGDEIVHTFTEADTYTVRLTVTNDAMDTDTATVQITVVKQVSLQPGFTVQPQLLHPGERIVVTDTSYGLGEEITSWVWDFGDGSPPVASDGPGASVSHIYVKAGTYEVTLTVGNGLGTVKLGKPVLVQPHDYRIAAPAVAAASPSGPTNVPPTAVLSAQIEATEGELVWLDGADSLSPTGRALSYQWAQTSGPTVSTIGQGTPWLRFGAPGYDQGPLEFTLIVSDGILASEPAKVQVVLLEAPTTSPPASAAFEREAQDTVHHFRATGLGPGMSVEWDFGDGATSSQVAPVHTYQEPGTYKVRLTVRDAAGGMDTREESITIEAPSDGEPYTTGPGSTTGGFPWLWVVLAVAGVLVGAGIVFVVARRRN